ncbi:MAG: thiamine-phosphate kinase [Elusimicrobia bacterium]|nr:thiamine-phosphate kinase [Elusimicrobiota bacterium]
MKTRTIENVGEFGLIEFIKKHNTKPKKYHNIYIDIGDDCFSFNSHKNSKYIVTTDILIENIHFKRDWATAKQIGQKAIEVNVSDIASMGNTKPLYAFISMGIPKSTSVKFVKELFNSIKNTCNKYDIHLSGGDTVCAKDITISVTLIGVCYDKPISRTGAKNGDLIFVTGTFGDSCAGLEILSNNKKNLTVYEKNLIKKHLVSQARLKEANIISQNINVTSMTDSSDGLFKSIELLTEKKGAVIYMDKIPLSENLIKYSNKNYNKLYNYALFGGEEFELVFTINKKDKNKLEKLLPGATCIGYINNSKVTYLQNGKTKNVKYNGYKHF